MEGVVLDPNYPERIAVDLEEQRVQSLRDVTLVRKQFIEFVCRQSGCVLMPLPGSDVVVCGGKEFLLPVITHMEFRYQSEDPESKDNPYSSVLKGYVSRNRDDRIACLNDCDFKASVTYEYAQRIKKLERDRLILKGSSFPPLVKAEGSIVARVMLYKDKNVPVTER